jgi:hypothetical protein
MIDQIQSLISEVVLPYGIAVSGIGRKMHLSIRNDIHIEKR